MSFIAFALLSLANSPAVAVTAVAQPLPMVGGFKDIDAERADVQEAAQFAAAELNMELASIDRAQSKSVAAYLFLLELSGVDGMRWRVEVTKPLRGGTWSILSQEQLDAGEPEAHEH